MKARSVLIGFLTGGVIAGITALLTTPTSGKETREYIKENKEEWLKQLKELKLNIVELKDSIAVLSSEGKEGITTFIQDIKTTVDSWQKEIKPHQEQLKSELAVLQDTLAELEASIGREIN